ncbi:MAG: DnaA/Hda family protein [bacterium]|nr:DnaA/Hda family protein [bacterium]
MKIPGFKCRPTDPSMTFATFIEGESNRLARAMAMLTCDKPGGSCNPLYIYGGRGLGKSHLIQAIANELAERGRKVAFCTGQDALDEGAEIDGAIDAILIDDICMLNSYAEQGFIRFTEKGGQLVLSGSESVESLPDSPLSRFIIREGKAADIGLPEEELRVAILRSKAEVEGIALPDDAAEFLANHISKNIASLLGALKRVSAHSALAGQKISRFSAIESLKDYIWIEKDD